MDRAHVMIALPTHDHWVADFGMALCAMIKYCSLPSTPPMLPELKQESFRVYSTRGSILPKMREDLVERAKEDGATHILFIDTDMTFPMQTLHMLMGHRQLVVAANCVTKRMPATVTARHYDPDNRAGRPVITGEKLGIEQVWRVGTGIMLINMSVFSKLKKPWFASHWKKGEYVGEDWAFCENCQAAGIPIFVDHELSQHVGHVGQMEYNQSCIISDEEMEKVRSAFAA